MMRNKVVIESKYLLDYYEPENGVTIGGSQRYTLDLGRLLYELGFEVHYIAKSIRDCELNYEGWAIIHGVKTKISKLEPYNYSKNVYKKSKEIDPSFVCYSTLENAFPYCYKNSFAIQHGVWWDGPGNIQRASKYYGYAIRKATSNMKFVVCVDTNFINWYRQFYNKYEKVRHKLHYVPNYADSNQFNIEKTKSLNSNLPNLLFARRLEEHRGYRIFLQMSRILKNKGYSFKSVILTDKKNANKTEKLIDEYADLDLSFFYPEFNEINEYYQNAYLSFIPTLWSEGTSLSAIESIMCGCPVVASDIGGLGNIIMNEFNGLIIPPVPEIFANITAKLLDDIDRREQMSKNCISMREAFGKERWKRQLVDLITEHMLNHQDNSNNEDYYE